MEKAKLSLIVPCYNEVGNVTAFYEAAKEAFADMLSSLEMVFVDDGSQDGTYDKLAGIYADAAGKCRVKVVRFSRNFGKEAAMYAGLQHADGAYLCLIDADLQQPPAVAKHMMTILDEKPAVDCVAAYQAVRHEGRFMSFMKKAFYRVINRMTEVNFVSGASDFRMFRRNVADAILALEEKYRFSKGIFSWIGFETEYIPYEAQKRFSGEAKWSFRKLMKYAVGGITSFSVTPLRVAAHIGGFFSAAALLYFFVVLAQKLIWSIPIPGYATLVCLILLLGGLQLIMLGIIGDYLGKVYIEEKNRPIYITKTVLGEDEDDEDADARL